MRAQPRAATHPYSSKQCLSLIMDGCTASSVRMMRFCRQPGEKSRSVK